MSGDRFERELRSTLRDLAAEPAPERLVERVGGIPTGTQPRGRTRFSGALRLATGLAAAAVVVVAASAVLLSRPTSSGSGGAAPGGAPASAVPTTSATASRSITAPPSGTTAPAASPSGTAPSGAAVPRGFSPVSVTFVSADEGFVLGSAPCAASPCTVILRTVDGGRTWAAVGAPAAPLGTPNANGGLDPMQATGVSGLRFADPRDGWAFGPGLWVTHDGGATWRELAVPGGSGASVAALEVADGRAHAVVYDVASGKAFVASTPVAQDAWARSTATVQIGAGPVPQAQLVLSGSAGWFVEVDRTVVGGLRLVDGRWTGWTPPCVDVLGPASLAASGPSELVAACQGGVWGPPKDPRQQGEHLYRSADGGTTFAEMPAQVPLDSASALATSGPSVILLGGSTGQAVEIAGTFDAGSTWATVLRLTNGSASYLGFTTYLQGVVLSTGSDGNALWMTRDGGHTWGEVTFAAS